MEVYVLRIAESLRSVESQALYGIDARSVNLDRIVAQFYSGDHHVGVGGWNPAGRRSGGVRPPVGRNIPVPPALVIEGVGGRERRRQCGGGEKQYREALHRFDFYGVIKIDGRPVFYFYQTGYSEIYNVI